MGVIAIVAIDILSASVGFLGHSTPTTIQEVGVIAAGDAISAVIYMIALSVLYKFKHRFTAILLLFVGAIAGQFLFV